MSIEGDFRACDLGTVTPGIPAAWNVCNTSAVFSSAVLIDDRILGDYRKRNLKRFGPERVAPGFKMGDVVLTQKELSIRAERKLGFVPVFSAQQKRTNGAPTGRKTVKAFELFEDYERYRLLYVDAEYNFALLCPFDTRDYDTAVASVSFAREPFRQYDEAAFLMPLLTASTGYELVAGAGRNLITSTDLRAARHAEARRWRDRLTAEKLSFCFLSRQLMYGVVGSPVFVREKGGLQLFGLVVGLDNNDMEPGREQTGFVLTIDAVVQRSHTFGGVNLLSKQAVENVSSDRPTYRSWERTGSAPFRLERTKEMIPQITGTFYNTGPNKEDQSIGVFRLGREAIFCAWGLRGEYCCSRHAIRHEDGRWLPPQLGCPKIDPIREAEQIVGIRLSAAQYQREIRFSQDILKTHHKR